ncbi:MAG: FAD-binding oxidoreductase [Chloroflexi bacterium]|nr:FAD-binding oxidoreductase [Chloroflexota bacterium]
MKTLTEFSVDGVTPRGIEIPENADALAQILKRAADEKRVVIPRGGGTMMEFGAPIERADPSTSSGQVILLSLEKLDHVLNYQPADLTVRVQAGLTLSALNQTLAHNGQFLPLDPPFPERATIGGILATNASGPLRAHFGSARDRVIGMRVALTDGTLIQSGGQVVKNVAGYDLQKLFIGSLGTLGIIVEATFKVSPAPKFAATIFAAFENIESANAVAQRVLKSPLAPHALEILNRDASKLLGFGSLYSLFVKFAGTARAVEHQIEIVDEWSRAHAALTTSVATNADATWARLRDFIFESATVVKISIMPSALVELSARAEEIARLREVKWIMRASAVGVAFIALDGARVAEAISDLRAAAEKLGGHLIIVRASRELRARVDVWGAPRRDFAVMQKLKMEFDPQRVLNPGRFVGGI